MIKGDGSTENRTVQEDCMRAAAVEGLLGAFGFGTNNPEVPLQLTPTHALPAYPFHRRPAGAGSIDRGHHGSVPSLAEI